MLKNMVSRLRTKNNIAITLASALMFTGSIGTGAYQGLMDTVQLDVAGQEQTVRTSANTVEELLVEQNIIISEHDEVTPTMNTKVRNNLEIVVEKAFPITLNVAGIEEQSWSTSITVADFLKEHEIALNEFDRVEPSLETVVTPDSIIHITRVEKVTDVVEEAIPYETTKENNSALVVGTEEVVANGVNGTVQQMYEIVKENGQEVSRTLVAENIVKEQQNRVISVGTKPVVTKTAEPAGREMYVTATAYAASEPGNEGLTAGGFNIQKNPSMKLIAVDPKVIPLGTKVWVEGYGYAVAGDTGGAIKGKKIDILLPNMKAVNAFGIQKVKIKVLS